MKHRKNFCKARVDREIRITLSILKYSQKRAAGYRALLEKIRTETRLLQGSGNARPDEWPLKTLRVLKNLALHAPDWINAPEGWHCPAENPHVVLRSLIRHLLCRYSLPGFLDLVWMRMPTVSVVAWQEIYKKMGRGKSFRKSQKPWSYTRAMENHFLKAPDHFSFEEALVYGMVCGAGGSETLALVFSQSKACQYVEHLDFWKTVVAFFTKENEDRTDRVTAVIDFIIAQKFAHREMASAEGIIDVAPPRPDFSLKGRTIFSVMKLVEKWHAGLSRLSKASDFSWPASGIRPFLLPWRSLDEKARSYEWTITELTNSAQLRQEGMTMNHCVVSYAGYCSRGRSSIWSMRLKTEKSTKRVLTIEVEPRLKKIVQVRGKCNRLMTPAEREILEKWAGVEQLELVKGA